MTSQIYSQTGALSDCKPAIFNGKATWYASNPLTAKTDGIITYATPFTVFLIFYFSASAVGVAMASVSVSPFTMVSYALNISFTVILFTRNTLSPTTAA